MVQNKKECFIISQECPDDINGIREGNLAAFTGPGEASLVEGLRQACSNFVSLVAKIGCQVVGHILFTPVRIETPAGDCIEGMGLGPMAVLPEYQNKGIGSALCKTGLKTIEQRGVSYVVVLGHPSYYPRFGFKPASAYGITCAYQDVPNDAFMMRVFDSAVLSGVQGVAHYRKEFDQVS